MRRVAPVYACPRNWLAVALWATVLVGCTTAEPRKAADTLPEAFQHCGPPPADGWRLVEPPADSALILAIPAEKGTLDGDLGHRTPGESMHEHWFAKDETHLAVCRHLDVPDSCYSDATFAYLKQVDGHWMVDGHVLESICLVHERIK